MKKWLTLSFVILVTGFILYATLVTKVYHKEITIKVPILKLHNQISFINAIAKWYVPFSSSDISTVKIIDKDKIITSSTALTIIKLNGMSSLFKINENGKTNKVLFSINDDNAVNRTVRLSYENTLWNKLLGNNSIINNAEKSLESLKNYIEDTKITYGYKIALTEVTDTTFLFTSKVVAQNKKKEELKNLYEILIKYAKEKNAGYNDTRILYLVPAGKDSIRFYAGIGITKNIENMPLEGSITLRRMPYKRNLIVADYKDCFSKLDKVFTAMEQYRTDNSLTSMAIPFIKFATEGIEFDDNQIIEGKGYFPVL
jgi:hypothetical protein